MKWKVFLPLLLSVFLLSCTALDGAVGGWLIVVVERLASESIVDVVSLYCALRHSIHEVSYRRRADPIYSGLADVIRRELRIVFGMPSEPGARRSRSGSRAEATCGQHVPAQGVLAMFGNGECFFEVRPFAQFTARPSLSKWRSTNRGPLCPMRSEQARQKGAGILSTQPRFTR
jgi:hypothetical protein